MSALLAALLLAAAPAAFADELEQSQDFGNRTIHASQASVNSQFLAFPLPMTNWREGRWQVGMAGGYSDVDASVLKLDGPLGSLGFSYAFADHFGVYALGFFNTLSRSGGGEVPFVTPFSNNVNIAQPAGGGFTLARYSDVTGTVRQTGGGVGLVWDPKGQDDDGPSWPMYFGLIANKVDIEDASAAYEILNGPDAGVKGRQYTDGSYSFLMPFAGMQYAFNAGESFKLIPSVLVSLSLASEPQAGRVTGTAVKIFDESGDTETAGNSDANFHLLVFAPGFTVLYRPWGLGVNVGATIFKAAAASTLYDGIEKVLTFNASWRFGDYAR